MPSLEYEGTNCFCKRILAGCVCLGAGAAVLLRSSTLSFSYGYGIHLTSTDSVAASNTVWHGMEREGEGESKPVDSVVSPRPFTTMLPARATTVSPRPSTTRLPAKVTTAMQATSIGTSICNATRECGTWVRTQEPKFQSQQIRGQPFYNKHIVMIGDSRMRYQYLSLAYFFTHGAFATGNDFSFLINAKQFTEKLAEPWNFWFNKTNHVLKHELCNCYRPKGSLANAVENRYYRHPEKMVSVTYLQKYGPALMQGHWHSDGTSIDLCNCQCGPRACNPLIETPKWTATNMSQLARIVADLKPDYLVLQPGWEEFQAWSTDDLFRFFSLVQKSCPDAQLYFKTRLIKSTENAHGFLSWANSYYRDMYKRLNFSQHGWHMWDVSTITASWKANDTKATFMWDPWHYSLASNNALNRFMLQTLFGVDVQQLDT